MDNRLKEMNDYILTIEKKANLLINKYQKCNEDLKSAIQKIGELTNKLEKNESSIKDAKKKIDNLINNIKTGRLQKMSNVTIDIKNREFLIACEDGKEQEVNIQLCDVRETFEKYNLISGLHTFYKKKESIYENLLPPLRVLNDKSEKDLINNLEKLNFSIKSLMAA